MKIEHIGMAVANPIAMGEWYVKHLGFRAVRRSGTDAGGVIFIVDRADGTVLELYSTSAAAPVDLRSYEALQLHLAIDCENPEAEAKRLVAAGAEMIGECSGNDYPGEKFFIRDPFGLVLQLLNRKQKLESA